MPALNTPPDHSFSRQVLEICRDVVGVAKIDFRGAPYGSDAAWLADRVPCIVLGPGSIDSAHAVDENVDLNEVVSAAQIYHAILMSDA